METDGARRPGNTVAVIVHWGEPAVTLELADTYLASGAFDQILVIANDQREAEPNRPEISWHVPRRNLGFGSACQHAASLVDVERYAFLNTDVRLLDGAAQRCLDALSVSGIGISGPVLLHDDGGLQSGCGTWTAFLGTPRALTAPNGDIARCSWVTGAALFCRREVLDEVGFDGSYFLGGEDADLCDRASERGWGSAIVTAARGYHKGGATMTGGRWQYYTIRNRVWFARKRRSRPAAVACFLWTALVLLPRIAVADTVKRRGYYLTYSAWRGVLDARANLPPTREPWGNEPVPQEWMEW